ncbi:MAG: LytTR family DNA-binding domain-containing protein [Bacteroidales bacterium]|nr:LytTR family DNA-binding domain-containing protein [Bacteroidales bacterium]
MKIKCITIDDEPLALKQMQSYIQKTPFLELVAACQSAFDAMEILANEDIDLLFVDINMPDLNGLDFVKSLNKKPLIIFTTAYSEYALEGFKVDAIDYLLKPIAYHDFLKAAHKAEKYLINVKDLSEKLQSDNEHLFIKSEYKIIRINLSDIKYIEGMREYVRIHLLNSKPVMSLLSMKSIEQQLPANRFMRVHRSFIVNLIQVNMIERNRIVFDNDVYIPISEQYKDKFQAFLDKNFLS